MLKRLRLLTSTFAIITLIIAGFFLLKQQYKQFNERKTIDQEISQLKEQESKLSKENQQLSQTLSYLNTNDYKEQIAREQLNLKRDGELVVNFTEKQGVTNQEANNAALNSSGNFEKWWTYLFKHTQ